MASPVRSAQLLSGSNHPFIKAFFALKQAGRAFLFGPDRSHPFKLSPIELSVLRALENTRGPVTPGSISISYAANNPELYEPILERFVRFGLARFKDGNYYRRGK